jgi:hypothetical protein
MDATDGKTAAGLSVRSGVRSVVEFRSGSAMTGLHLTPSHPSDRLFSLGGLANCDCWQPKSHGGHHR